MINELMRVLKNIGRVINDSKEYQLFTGTSGKQNISISNMETSLMRAELISKLMRVIKKKEIRRVLVWAFKEKKSSIRKKNNEQR